MSHKGDADREKNNTKSRYKNKLLLARLMVRFGTQRPSVTLIKIEKGIQAKHTRTLAVEIVYSRIIFLKDFISRRDCQQTHVVKFFVLLQTLKLKCLLPGKRQYNLAVEKVSK